MYTNNPHLVELEDMIEVRAMQFAKVAGENLLSLTVKLRDDLSDAESEVHGLLLTDGVTPKIFLPEPQSAQEVQEEAKSEPPTDNAPTTSVEGSEAALPVQPDTKTTKSGKAVPVVPVSE